MGFFNLQMGHYNKISIHTRDFAQLAEVFEQITLFLKNNSGKLDQVVTKELDTLQHATAAIVKQSQSPAPGMP